MPLQVVLNMVIPISLCCGHSASPFAHLEKTHAPVGACLMFHKVFFKRAMNPDQREASQDEAIPPLILRHLCRAMPCYICEKRWGHWGHGVNTQQIRADTGIVLSPASQNPWGAQRTKLGIDRSCPQRPHFVPSQNSHVGDKPKPLVARDDGC
ncbi:hypothetical protein D3C75_942270 [compost metagenome]